MQEECAQKQHLTCICNYEVIPETPLEQIRKNEFAVKQHFIGRKNVEHILYLCPNNIKYGKKQIIE